MASKNVNFFSFKLPCTHIEVEKCVVVVLGIFVCLFFFHFCYKFHKF